MKAHGSFWDTLVKSKQLQFERVCDVLITRKDACEKAKIELRDKGINIVAIANDTGIVRKTFYNNPLLKEFVEEFASSLSDFSEEKEKELTKVKEQNAFLSEQIRLMSIRDCETESLKHGNEELMREIEQKNIRIRNLEEQLEKALNNLGEAQRTPKIYKINNYS